MTTTATTEFTNITANMATPGPQQSIQSKTHQKHLEGPQLMTNAQPFDYSRFGVSPVSPRIVLGSRSMIQDASSSPLLNRFLMQNGHGPLVPPKETYNLSLAKTGIAEALPTPALPRNIWAILDSSLVESDQSPVERPAPLNIKKSARLKKSSSFGDLSKANVAAETRADSPSSSDKRDAVTMGPMCLNKALPRVPFSMDDSGLITPPPAPLLARSLESELGTFKLTIDPSPFDPPPAPRLSRFPVEFPPTPLRSKPAPLDISHAAPGLDWVVQTEMDSGAHPESQSGSQPSAPNLARKLHVTRINLLENQKAQIKSARPAPIKLRKGVRFENVRSPAYSNLKSPALRDLKSPGPSSRFHQPLSPPEFSPITPQAMVLQHPAIVSDSPYLESPVLPHVNMKLDSRYTPASRGRSQTHPRFAEPRARSASLPRRNRLADTEDTTILPASTYDQNTVSDSTLNWLGMLPKASYQVSANRTDDRSRILGSYFHRARPSM